MMQVDKSFEVPLAPEVVWPLLLDIRLVSDCMPGAELTRMIDRGRYEGRITMTLGPVTLRFDGEVAIADVHADERMVWIRTHGTASGNAGGVVIVTRLHLQPSDRGTRIGMQVSVKLTGGLSAYDGAGLVQVANDHVASQFAENLRARLVWQAKGGTAHSPPPPVAAKPMSTTSLVGHMLRRAIGRPFGRS